MPGGSKDLKRRIKSVKNTRQTTRAMEMVSASKLRRSQQALEAAAPFGKKLMEMLSYLIATGGVPNDPLFVVRTPVKSRLVVLLAADRGLCGGYNNNLFKFFREYMKEQVAAGIDINLFPVGRRAVEFVNRKYGSVPQLGSVPDQQGKVQHSNAAAIANASMDAFRSGKVDEVVFIYNRFINTIVYRQTKETFLPLSSASLGELSAADKKFLESTRYIYEPSSERVFQALLPDFVQSRVFTIIASSITAEHSARMVAMSSATKNCKELIDSLTLKMNKARQAAITTEISEIVAGAEALKG